MNLPKVVIFECTCQVSDTLIVEMLTAYTASAAATNFPCPGFHKIECIQDDRLIPCIICMYDHMPMGIHHAYMPHPQVSFG